MNIKIIILKFLDTTQEMVSIPGASMSLDEKLQMKIFDEMGVI